MLSDVTLVDEDLSNYRGEHFMDKSRRQCLDVAANYGSHKVIVWLEPEKHPMISNEQKFIYGSYLNVFPTILPLIIFSSVVYEGAADIVVPRRKDNLASHQFQQQVEELTGNMALFDMLRVYVSEKVESNHLRNVSW